MGLRHLYCCHSPEVFDKLTPRIELIDEGGVPKLSEYVKVAEAAEIIEASQGTVRT
jgi:hypothetical protein